MKIIFTTLLSITLLLASCAKDKCNAVASTKVAPSSEINDIKTYLNSFSIQATQHASGFFYNITTQGTGTTTPTLCNSITVSYTAKLTDGTEIDKGTKVTFTLGDLIIAWQNAIPLLKTGGKITIYAPPSLAYGSGAGSIPPNSILIFEVELVGIK